MPDRAAPTDPSSVSAPPPAAPPDAEPEGSAPPRRRRSLRRTLLIYLLAPLGAALAVNTAVTYRTALDSANQAYDRTLQGALLAISERVTVDDGLIRIDLPYSALEMLENDFQDRIYYRVSHPEQGEITGYPDLPEPLPGKRFGISRAISGEASSDEVHNRKPFFYETAYHGEHLRIAAQWRPLFYPGIRGPLLIQIGETQGARNQLARQLLLESLVKEGVLIVFAALLIAFGVLHALGPLRRLRHEVAARDPLDLSPLAADNVPSEVTPLVDAVNAHTARVRQLTAAQRQFIDDAAHQLKTPLAIIKSQADLAQRETDPLRLQRMVGDIGQTATATARLVQQLLTLARSDAAPPASQVLNLTELARQVTFDWLPQALARRIDLGFAGEVPCPVRGDEVLLRELVANLIDNALRYTPAGGVVTVEVGVERKTATNADKAVVLRVDDSGPGIGIDERERVFDRFYRPAGSSAPGNGLGLAIVRAIARRHGGEVGLDDGPEGRGLRVTVHLPAVGGENDAD